MSSISFDNPYLLFLAIPLVVLFVVPFFISVRKSNANFHNITSGVIHIFIALIIAMAAAGLTVETTVTETNVYVLADVSYSSNRNLDTLDNYIEQLKDNLPGNSKMGVVCFGKGQQMLVPLGKSLKSVKAADLDFIDDSETDITGAMEYASTLFRDDVIKRVVVMTDGKQTHLEDSNALKRAADELRAEGILVDAVYLDNNISDDAKEVQIMSAEVTQNTYLNKDEKAVVSIRSTYDNVKAELSMTESGAARLSRPVVLNKGYNTIELPLNTSTEGSVDYEITIDAEGDENLLNNNIKFSQNVSGAVSVMIICEDKNSSDVDYLRYRYGTDATVDVYDVGDDIPSKIEELCEYDEIVISEVDLSRTANYEYLLNNINTAVSMFGKSLVTYGNVYTHDKTELSALADMLPVRYGKTDNDAKLFTLVIDASRSMEQLDKSTIAKAAAKQLAGTLSNGDYICIVTFNGNYRIVMSPSMIGGDTDIKAINAAIDSIGLEHGTIISFGLEQALAQIKGLDFSEKQIMLISDGLTVGMDNESDRIDNAIKELSSRRIATSVIDVGRGNDTSDTANNAAARLGKIANQTGGKYALIQSEDNVGEAIFQTGILDEVASVVVDSPAFVSVKRSTDSVLSGVTMKSTDYVLGFVRNKAKPGAVTVMALSYDDNDIPLYAYWNYGKGRVASMSSNVSQTYVEDSPWEDRDVLYSNITTTNIPSEKVDYPFAAELIEDNGYIKLNVVPAQFDTSVEITVSYTVPEEDEPHSDRMNFSGSAYEYSFETAAVGKYDITVEYKTLSGTVYTATFSHSVSFLSEYDSFAIYDVSVLYRMVGSEGTVMKEGDEIKIVNADGMAEMYMVKLFVPLLVTAVVLFLIDIVIRKLKWADIRSLIGKIKK